MTTGGVALACVIRRAQNVHTVEEPRANITDSKDHEITKRMPQQHGDACIGERGVYEWVDAVKLTHTPSYDRSNSERFYCEMRPQILQHFPTDAWSSSSLITVCLQH